MNALESRNNPDTETLSLIYLPNQARWKVQPPTEVTKSPTDANNSTQSPFKANNLRQSPVKASYSRQSPVEANVSIQSYSKGNARVEIPRPISSFLVKSQIGGGGGACFPAASCAGLMGHFGLSKGFTFFTLYYCGYTFSRP